MISVINFLHSGKDVGLPGFGETIESAKKRAVHRLDDVGSRLLSWSSDDAMGSEASLKLLPSCRARPRLRNCAPELRELVTSAFHTLVIGMSKGLLQHRAGLGSECSINRIRKVCPPLTAKGGQDSGVMFPRCDRMTKDDLGGACDLLLPGVAVAGAQRLPGNGIDFRHNHMQMPVKQCCISLGFAMLHYDSRFRVDPKLVGKTLHYVEHLFPRRWMSWSNNKVAYCVLAFAMARIGEGIPNVLLGAAQQRDLFVLIAAKEMIEKALGAAPRPNAHAFDDHNGLRGSGNPEVTVSFAAEYPDRIAEASGLLGSEPSGKFFNLVGMPTDGGKTRTHRIVADASSRSVESAPNKH